MTKTEPLSLEEFISLMKRYPLIFDVSNIDLSGEAAGFQPEFANFVFSHKDTLTKTINHCAEELKGTGATWGIAVIKGFEHIIELFLGIDLNEEHLPTIVASMYNSGEINEQSKRWLETEIVEDD